MTLSPPGSSKSRTDPMEMLGPPGEAAGEPCHLLAPAPLRAVQPGDPAAGRPRGGSRGRTTPEHGVRALPAGEAPLEHHTRSPAPHLRPSGLRLGRLPGFHSQGTGHRASLRG